MLSVADNMTIAHIKSYLKSSRLLDFSKMKDDCEKYVDEINVKTPSLRQEIQYLSGGNQQKVLVARWLLTSPDILFMDEPTRGIDVGAKAEIYKLIDRLAQLGKAVVMISSELPEIIGMSDRIMVMHEGHMTAMLENDDSVTQEKIISYATGVLDDFPEQA
jgi:methyl-galactoside transport system ATP-binding protein/inositol transport system ATP-binding protein